MRIQKLSVFSILPLTPIYTTLSIAKGHSTINYPLMINLNDLQLIPLTKVFMSIIPPNYSFVTPKIIWNKGIRCNQVKRNIKTQRSYHNKKPSRLLLHSQESRLGFSYSQNQFPEPKAESAFLADSVFQFFFCTIL